MANPDYIKAMLSEQIQEERLRIYFFTSSYTLLSTIPSLLAPSRCLRYRKVAAIVSKMISHELAAALDQVSLGLPSISDKVLS